MWVSIGIKERTIVVDGRLMVELVPLGLFCHGYHMCDFLGGTFWEVRKFVQYLHTRGELMSFLVSKDCAIDCSGGPDSAYGLIVDFHDAEEADYIEGFWIDD